MDGSRRALHSHGEFRTTSLGKCSPTQVPTNPIQICRYCSGVTSLFPKTSLIASAVLHGWIKNIGISVTGWFYLASGQYNCEPSTNPKTYAHSYTTHDSKVSKTESVLSRYEEPIDSVYTLGLRARKIAEKEVKDWDTVGGG